MNWSASLSSRQRVLLHAQPIMQMRQSWSGRDDEDLRYDPMCLTMKLFDVVIDQSGFGNEVVRETVADALFPLLESLDEAAQVPPDKTRYRRVVDRLIAGLLNEANHNESFAVDYSDFDETGRASRKTFAFKLLKEVHGYSGEIVLQLSVGGDQPIPQRPGLGHRKRADRQRGGRAVPVGAGKVRQGPGVCRERPGAVAEVRGEDTPHHRADETRCPAR